MGFSISNFLGSLRGHTKGVSTEFHTSTKPPVQPSNLSLSVNVRDDSFEIKGGARGGTVDLKGDYRR